MGFPAATVVCPILQPGQMNFGGVNGVTFAGTVAGSPYQLVQAQGLDMPAIVSGDVDIPRDQGQLPGLDTYGGRSITVDITVVADAVSLEHAKQQFVAALNATGATETPLFMRLPGMTTVAVMARARKWAWTLDVHAIAGGYQPGSVMFYCTDPRIYGAPSWDTVTALTATSQTMTVVNGGNEEMRPIVTFIGPINAPFAANNSLPGAPRVTLVNPASGSTVLGGDKVTVDMARHAVVYVPAAGAPYTVRNWVTAGSSFWNLPPGANTVAFGANAATGSFEITWAWAWQL